MRVGRSSGRIVGLDWIDLTRRAVAERIEGTTKLAIFAGSTDCAKKDCASTGTTSTSPATCTATASTPSTAAARRDQLHGHERHDRESRTASADANPTGPPTGVPPALSTATARANGCRRTGTSCNGPIGSTRPTSAGTCPQQPGAGPLHVQGRRHRDRHRRAQDQRRSDADAADRSRHRLDDHSDRHVLRDEVVQDRRQQPPRSRSRRSRPSSRSTATGQHYTPHAGDMLFFTVPNNDTRPRRRRPVHARELHPTDRRRTRPATLSGGPTELNGEDYPGRDHLQPVRQGQDQQQDAAPSAPRSSSARSTASRSTSTATSFNMDRHRGHRDSDLSASSRLVE